MSAFATTTTNTNPRSEFESQRAELVREIALVGNEFSSVETLWSQFENVMGATEEGQQQQQQTQAQQQPEQDNRDDGEAGGDDVDVKREEDEYESR
ncbi:uncharacterized protein BHQ10_006902 [Talaromyces amestolkiae]|uniref:DASH complex subunit DAD1 n=1 Tax=Talaromyces amestolkiae TaxID=1196081 RepID=A0A364L507_TALAM|nr:uncharacterized protein BHQ10_006902 [Talaromyces amestolkiae]RAO70890.1 hypothetical protein BHQ10_006902 [Talaromyces amestolkiae]